MASATSVGSAAGTASTSASAAPTSPCPEGARKDDDVRYCITLPPKPLALSYEGDNPSQGITEVLEVKGDRLIITIGPAPKGKTASALKEAAQKQDATTLLESGDLPDGYWTERKAGAGKWVIEGTAVSAKYIIRCVFQVDDEKNLEAGRSTCKSLRVF